MTERIDFSKYSDQEFFAQFFLANKETHEEYLILKAAAEGCTKISEPDYDAAFGEAQKRLRALLG